jgi:hypothetical protein
MDRMESNMQAPQRITIDNDRGSLPVRTIKRRIDRLS